MTIAREFAAMEARWRPYWAEIDLYRTGDDPRAAQPLHPRLLPLPFRRWAVGGPLSQLRAHLRQRALHAHAGLQRAASDGLGRLRPAGRELRHRPRRPSRVTTARQAANYRRQLDPGRVQLRLVAGDQLHRSRLLPLDAVVLQAAVRPRPGLPRRRQPMVVPRLPDHPGQRAGGRGALLALRQRGRQEDAAAVVFPHHRLRRPAAGRAGTRRLAGNISRRCSATGSAAATGRRSTSRLQLPVNRSRSPSSPPGPTPCLASPSWPWPRSIRCWQR